MKESRKNFYSLPKVFIIFIAVMTLVSVFGGYQLTQLVYRLNNFSMQRTDQLLSVEKNLDDASIALGRQVQEWKDMLIRANDAELYIKHQKAFMNASVAVQEALLQTKNSMQGIGIDTGPIEQLRIEHESLVSYYLVAQTQLNPLKIESSRLVDKQVIGVDRKLQQHFATVKVSLGQLTNQQLKRTTTTERNSYLIIGLLGALCLLIMALLGFVFASKFQNYKAEAA